VLELSGADLRERPLRERRALLEDLLRGRSERLSLSAAVEAPSWAGLRELREGSRERGVEGLMLKRWTSAYQGGRRRGDWWKWKIDPYSIDAVLVYAQPGHGRRATLMTDLTFAVWDEGVLVPVAKAYSGLTDEEIDRLDRWIRQNTLERFGPVRAVKPEHVFELHFEAIAESPRHKSGIAVRFPRIARWRTDKKPADADSIDSLRALLRADPTSRPSP
jgi:DNA ligase-1